MNSSEIKEMTIAMRTGKIKMEREGMYWTEEEREYARQQFYGGVPINEIAIELKRSETAVEQHVAGLHIRPPENTRTRQIVIKEPVCQCATCACDRSLCPLCHVYQKLQEVSSAR